MEIIVESTCFPLANVLYYIQKRNTTNQEDKMNRNEIADELMRGCPVESESFHRAVATAIRLRKPISEILDMCDDWPDTYHWLKTELID